MMGPLLFGILIMLTVLIGFFGVWRVVRAVDPTEARLAQFGFRNDAAVALSGGAHGKEPRAGLSAMNRLMTGAGWGQRLAESLSQADVPMTAAEFVAVLLGAVVLGFVIGTLRAGAALGLVLAVIGGFMPLLYVRARRQRRQRAITDQLANMLTLLVGALRAGHGLTHALATVAEQLPPPTSTELNRVSRAIGLGLPVQRALQDMADRVGTDDVRLVITAINVQYTTGGNLAQTLEVISETVRDRLRIKREIRVLTAQQRFSGYVLAILPVFMAVAIYMLRPDYMSRLFEPGWIRLLPLTALILQILGYLVIRRIVDIEV